MKQQDAKVDHHEEQEGKAVITVRCSAALHFALKMAAHERYMSLNELCIELLSANQDKQ